MSELPRVDHRDAVDERRRREMDVWQSLRSLILDRYDYRRRVADALGMSFFRVKALRLLAGGPLTMRELAAALSTDAPYTTLLVDDLENRGLVLRTPHAADRRAKVVSVTAEGRRAAKRAMKILLTPPPPMSELSEQDLSCLERIVGLLAAEVPDDE